MRAALSRSRPEDRADELAEAVLRLREDGLVAFPTETVWGLAACARSRGAIDRLRAWKGRADDQPISVLVSGWGALAALDVTVSAHAQALMEAFWPGPLTLVLPTGAGLAPGVAREDGALGIRCSPHPLAARLVAEAERASLGPLTATSLNRSGDEPARTRAEALALCGDTLDLPLALDLEGAEAHGASPSTVVDLCGARPRVLRWGALRPADLASHLEAGPTPPSQRR